MIVISSKCVSVDSVLRLSVLREVWISEHSTGHPHPTAMLLTPVHLPRPLPSLCQSVVHGPGNNEIPRQ